MRSKLAVRDRSRRWSLSCLGTGLGRPRRRPAEGEDHLPGPRRRPVFRSRCGSCHNPDKQKGGLNLDNYGAAMQGGGSGKVIEPGDAESSTLFQVISHKEEPKMPPNSPKIPDAEIDLIRKWIEGGALENSGSVATAKAKPKFEFKLDPAALGKPAGPPAMPENLSTEPFVPQARPSAVVAMAVEPLGPAGRGRRPQAGAALSHDRPPPGRRAALPRRDDLRPQVQPQRRPAAGRRRPRRPVGARGRLGRQERGRGSSRSARNTTPSWRPTSAPITARSLSAGPARSSASTTRPTASLVYEMRKHTEWITAVEFSPDGVLLATGDRNNGLIVWEAQTGPRVLRPARPHRRPSPTSAGGSTRTSSPRRARTARSSSGRWRTAATSRSFGAHGGGAASVRFAKDGRLVTTGRDRVVRLWDQNGNKQRDFEALRRPGARGRLHATTSRRSSPPTGRARSASGTSRTGAGWRIWRSTRPRWRSGSSRRSRLLAAAQAEADSLTKQLAPLQNASPPAQAVVCAGPGQGRGGRAGRREADRGRPATGPGAEGQDGRGRRGPGHAPGRRAARGADGLGPGGGRRGGQPVGPGREGRDRCPERRQVRHREGPRRQDRPRPRAAGGRRVPQGGGDPRSRGQGGGGLDQARRRRPWI